MAEKISIGEHHEISGFYSSGFGDNPFICFTKNSQILTSNVTFVIVNNNFTKNEIGDEKDTSFDKRYTEREA